MGYVNDPMMGTFCERVSPKKGKYWVYVMWGAIPFGIVGSLRVREIKQNSGKIINIGSALSYTADKSCPPYIAAKHGVIGITRSFANELGQYNIQTNAICPGFLATEVNADMREQDPTFYSKINNRIAAGRWGEPVDLMGTMVYLASKASDYVNGWSISVDGGFTTVL